MDAIDELFDPSVMGIGCGVPSVVDVERGIVFDVENIPSWKEMHLKAALEERFGVPASSTTTPTPLSSASTSSAKGGAMQTSSGMTLGTGLGTGVIVDGRLYSGGNCGAGEIGMMAHKGLTAGGLLLRARSFVREYRRRRRRGLPAGARG